MPTCAEVLARTLRDAGVARMFGLPGGEILHFIEAARKVGIEFLLTRHETAAAFMADVTGQIGRRPGVCVATLGPGAVNMTLGVANAFLDRSPLIAITASLARSAEPYATHQQLDLNAVYRPFTKLAITLDGENTAAKVRRAYRTTREPRMGPVHIALPSDIARTQDRQTEDPASVSLDPPPHPARAARNHRTAENRDSDRPAAPSSFSASMSIRVAVAPAVRAFVERLGAPTFVTPKAKGILPEDHPALFRSMRGRRWRRGYRRSFQQGRSADRCRVRTGRVRQALAPHDEAGVPRTGIDCRRRVSSGDRGGRRCQPYARRADARDLSTARLVRSGVSRVS